LFKEGDIVMRLPPECHLSAGHGSRIVSGEAASAEPGFESAGKSTLGLDFRFSIEDEV
jgi:hypothetical protein